MHTCLDARPNHMMSAQHDAHAAKLSPMSLQLFSITLHSHDNGFREQHKHHCRFSTDDLPTCRGPKALSRPVQPFACMKIIHCDALPWMHRRPLARPCKAMTSARNLQCKLAKHHRSVLSFHHLARTWRAPLRASFLAQVGMLSHLQHAQPLPTCSKSTLCSRKVFKQAFFARGRCHLGQLCFASMICALAKLDSGL